MDYSRRSIRRLKFWMTALFFAVFGSGCGSEKKNETASVSIVIPALTGAARDELAERLARRDQAIFESTEHYGSLRVEHQYQQHEDARLSGWEGYGNFRKLGDVTASNDGDGPESYNPPPKTIGGFDCLIVNIIGRGILETEDREPSSDPRPSVDAYIDKWLENPPDDFDTYVGKFSNIVPVTAGELRFQVEGIPPGSNRIVQLIGLKKSLNKADPTGSAACPSSLVGPDGKIGDIKLVPYLIGYKVIPNLLGDQAVEIPNQYAGALGGGANSLFSVLGNDGVPFRIYRGEFTSAPTAVSIPRASCDGASVTGVKESVSIPGTVGQVKYLNLTLTLANGAANYPKMQAQVNSIEFQGSYYAISAANLVQSVEISNCTMNFQVNSGQIVANPCPFNLKYQPTGTDSFAKVPNQFRVSYTINALDGTGRSVNASQNVPVSYFTAAGSGIPCYD